MFTIYRADDRFKADHGWLIGRHSFSFAEFHDDTNVSFGPMRVLNDDIVKPLRGFGAHPHSEMEIVSLVLDGQLKHEDSTGQSAVTTFGGIQRMTAGTGVVHSEVNPSSNEEVNFLQMWFFPDESNLTPSYEKTEFNVDQLKNNLLPVVSKTHSGKEIAYINQNLTIYLSDLEKGKELPFTQDEGRKILIFVIEGELSIKGKTLYRRDSVRISNKSNLDILANENTRFMLIDLPA
ncbi:pirin family protein [Bacillus spongiae]|uniref:Pirin family protein n=1 Tax=Bacillus spongiae TaxID=2683610 RepID=A0ABU8HAQ8_9BACI